jgi:hypothetical protein
MAVSQSSAKSLSLWLGLMAVMVEMVATLFSSLILK